MSVRIENGANVDVTVDRHLWVGGSDIPAMMGKGSFGDAYDLMVGKFGKLLGLNVEDDKGFMGKYIEYGNTMEPKIRKWWNRNYGYNFKEAVALDEVKGFRANVDGYDKRTHSLIEIKTHGDTLRMEEYEMQCQFYMHVFDVDAMVLLTYEREELKDNPMEFFNTRFKSNRLKVYEIGRDDDFIKSMLERITKFSAVAQQYIDSGGALTREEVLEAMIDDSVSKEIVKQSNELYALEKELDELKVKETQYKEMKAAMLSKMEEHGVYSLETENYKFSYIAPSKGKSFDKKNFEKDNPELASKYTKETNRKGYIRVSTKKQKD